MIGDEDYVVVGCGGMIKHSMPLFLGADNSLGVFFPAAELPRQSCILRCQLIDSCSYLALRGFWLRGVNIGFGI